MRVDRVTYCQIQADFSEALYVIPISREPPEVRRAKKRLNQRLAGLRDCERSLDGVDL
jgi:hypothetical protein